MPMITSQILKYLAFLKTQKSSDCNWTRTQNHLVLKRTLKHLAKVAKWLSVRLKTKWFWFRVQLQSLNLKITRGDRIHSVHRFTVQTS